VSVTTETAMAVTSPPAAAVEGLCPTELDAWRGLLRVHASVLKALDAELEAAHGLPLTSYEVLIQLAEAPDQRMRMCDLADSVLLSRSGMSRLVDRLERDGLLHRCACAHDARGAFACITADGLALLEQARPTHFAGIRRRFLSQLGEDELRQLGALWDRVVPQPPAV
jgi:DNA-binding MarR family transcriptional regulator